MNLGAPHQHHHHPEKTRCSERSFCHPVGLMQILDEDYKPSPSPSSIEDELLALESQSSCQNTPEKHHSHASSSETDTREAENQKAKGKAVQKGTKSKGKGKFKDDKKITVKRSIKRIMPESGTKSITVYSVKRLN